MQGAGGQALGLEPHPLGGGETCVSSKAGSRHGRHCRRAQKQRFDPGRLVCKGLVCMDTKQAAVESR